MKTKLALSILLLSLIFIFEKGNAQAWAWAKSGNGNISATNMGLSIAADINGNSYVTGFFTSPTISFGNVTLTNADSTGATSDIFIVKYDNFGNVLWAKRLGGIKDDVGNSIITDKIGNFYLTGYFDDSVAFGNTTLYGAYRDILILKCDTSGNIIWAKQAGGTSADIGNCITQDASGNLYLTGLFSGLAFFDSISVTDNGGYSIFIAKFDSSGNAIWARSPQAIDSDNEGLTVAVDTMANVFITGYFQSSSLDFGASVLINSNPFASFPDDIFIAKYDSAGNNLWAKGASGNERDEGISVVTDALGNSYMAGYFESTTISFDTIILTNTNTSVFHKRDIFLVKYNSSGNVAWARRIGGWEEENVSDISFDMDGNLLMTGSFNSYTFSLGLDTLTSSTNGADIFIAKFDTSGNAIWGTSVGGTGIDNYGSSVTIDGTGNLFLTGYYESHFLVFGNDTLSNPLIFNIDVFAAKLDVTTGFMEHNKITNKVIVYPNPASDFITIETGINKNQLITITDITGNIIYSTTTLVDKTIINTKDFPLGVYAVQVQAGESVETKRIIITR